mmetsp:Transcript_17701/g.35712  ORF Transcript_17701/g.35712 Transcript_17701/m.35712 type:complete len:230 (-) Transcript_17701:309-998(-)|eukprot:CAMPEP_0167794916 /NCGR_PEP_ID=MMETSP0111_2-20121227/14125_1 /TAXON_ID=91324 /ORGANISM="Lotharella globosa, Strain CCCM811" /LENGTH=229 /DNA_ID=CAMNT_0007688485 /DNA_START=56 /DNA_END=745 /DNA_ORIENTATION=-
MGLMCSKRPEGKQDGKKEADSDDHAHDPGHEDLKGGEEKVAPLRSGGPRQHRKSQMGHVRSPSHNAWDSNENFGPLWQTLQIQGILANQKKEEKVFASVGFKRSFMKFQIMGMEDPSIDFLVVKASSSYMINTVKEYKSGTSLAEVTADLEDTKGALVFACVDPIGKAVAGFIWAPSGASDRERYLSERLKKFTGHLTVKNHYVCKTKEDFDLDKAKKDMGITDSPDEF